eukprot:CAMPEP_0194262470 /NCGR_PEP_ID=MMETSP0158-20130606/46563_1 /TAXON_ID=33649 /ORGANISM="Thalassionema nitzschioides, Strain L26-B" /LENGTH=294 /DNA_ID=CAMNT_0039002629 /DNA_START=32 /DNA_END=915 /DNA_ORIENTATION=+
MEDGNSTRILQEVNVNYIPETICNEGSAYDGEVRDLTMFCAAGIGKDSCQGDSGGPLFRRTGNEFEQVGVVSWGRGCSREKFPGVYSRVSGQIEWIKSEICNLSDFKPEYCNTFGTGGTGDMTIRLDINYDQYVSEVSWSFHQNGQTPLFKLGSEGNNSLQGTYKVKLEPGPATFVITDVFSDGICCKFGNGGYKIFSETSEGDKLLAESEGQYGSWEIQDLVIPNIQNLPLPSSSPSLGPSLGPSLAPEFSPNFIPEFIPELSPEFIPELIPELSSELSSYLTSYLTFDLISY